MDNLVRDLPVHNKINTSLKLLLLLFLNFHSLFADSFYKYCIRSTRDCARSSSVDTSSKTLCGNENIT